MLPREQVLDTTECAVCKEQLQIVRVKAWKGESDRVLAREVESGKQHVCFSVPTDANLLILED